MRKKSTSLAAIPPILAVMGCWVLFVASSSLHELALGAGFTVLSAVVSWLAWREMSVRFMPTLRQIMPLWRLPWYILRDSVEVTVILAKDMLGIRRAGSLYRAIAFSTNSPRDEHDRAILATVATSMTPGIIVLGVTHDHLFLHQLQYDAIPRMVADLEAEP